MASSALTSRWLFRDLPWSYVVIAVAATVVAVVAFSIDWSSPPPPGAIASQSATAADELRYRGSIIVPTNTVGICRTMTMDNRTGNLADGGYGKCGPDAPRTAPKEGVEQARLRAVGNAFRH
jgi:hypothetical protein